MGRIVGLIVGAFVGITVGAFSDLVIPRPASHATYTIIVIACIWLGGRIFANLFEAKHR